MSNLLYCDVVFDLGKSYIIDNHRRRLAGSSVEIWFGQKILSNFEFSCITCEKHPVVRFAV